MLESSNLSTSIPAPDLECARTFYQDKLGLTPSEERPSVLQQFIRARRSTCSADSGRSSGLKSSSAGRTAR